MSNTSPGKFEGNASLEISEYLYMETLQGSYEEAYASHIFCERSLKQNQSLRGNKMTIIDEIQQDDPSFDPLTLALSKTTVSKETFRAACDRIYFDGYYGPIHPDEWKEQDGREPYTVKEALQIVAAVLDEVDDYRDEDCNVLCDAYEIRSALVYPWFKEIYGYGYPQL